MKKEFRNKSIPVRLIFSRFAITIFFLLIQLALLLVVFKWFGKYSTHMLGSLTFLSVLVIIHLLNNDSNPSYKLAWILPVSVVPIFGSLLYVYVQTNIGAIAPKKIIRKVLDETKEYGVTDESVRASIEGEDADFIKTASYIEKIGGYATYKNTEIEYHGTGEICFKAMMEEMEKAEHFIFMEYFILEEGIFWDSMLELLRRKVEEGVEVRVMYDDLGCVALLPRTYVKTLRSYGIKAQAFSALKPFLSTHYNNRDHRKIMVIDGQVAFNGGINIADEYINEKEVYGHWKDTAYKIKGDAVQGYMLMFLQLWNVEDLKGKEDYSHYLDIRSTCELQHTDGYVIPFGDGPHQQENVAEQVYMDIIHSAKKYVYIMSPYLILDNEMLQSITHAAKRGVKVKILLPHIPDKWFAIVIARNYYPELINAGVEVYQYTPGFVHAKMFVSDDEKAIVGTINLDFRSLYLHYECGGYFYKNKAVMDVKEDFDETFEQSQRMTIADYKKMKWIDRVCGHILKIIAPLL